ncbi:MULTISPECIES: IclR family transcriptional regulator [Bacillus]|uniref:IclR family transcriptional regulator n=1 Tax=Bacillus glycinifermentans TaxID=1664069 RepID=A0AAJ4D1L8_9BACI|nr:MULTISPECIES: IclR family transcriptional regulator [Bacillus]KKB74319.1 IclR family transcriptional regulator [Bacillus sp. TH008]MDU0073203.1 IclR family transcriptional regulator [Bacillus sp. IG6]MED8021040.1 IclR family transcriptional regulator [Bacillus glycinifermentans]QAT63956.1 IclR family transcriptional regulator [Bacillus glycinifermentans]WKB77837.1 IclR family transcriptional regulator [Bacillus glycinifermentans]
MESKNKTVVKAMTLLNLFLTREKLSLNDMIELTGMPKTSVYRMVRSLEDMGFLDRYEDGMYALGLLFLQYGQLVSDRLDIRKIALPVMEKLRDEVDEAVHLIVREGDEAMYIEKIEGTHTVRLYTAIGRRSPLYAGACARSILTFLPREERDEYIRKTDLVPIASGTIRDKDELARVLDESYRNGYTVSHSELEDYTSAIAAPIFNNKRQIVAGISIAGFEARFQNDRLPYLTERVRQAALEISRKLGF